MMNIIRTKTAIIGSGVSGISAAINLLDKNYDNFLVFEALERIGGRVTTENADQGFIEIGAQYIHGQEGNIFYEIAKNKNLINKKFDKIIPDTSDDLKIKYNSISKDNSLLKDVDISTCKDSTLFVTQDGKKIETEFAQSVYNSLTKIISNSKTSEIKRNADADNRLGDYLYDKFSKSLNTETGIDLSETSNVETEFKRKILNGLFLMRAKRESIKCGSANLFDVSLKNYSIFKESPGYKYIELENGFGSILNAIIEKHKEKFHQRVKLRHYLKKIILSKEHMQENNISDLYDRPDNHSKYTNDKNKAVLVMCDATNPQKPKDFIVICDNVLCTMSLGYLKENINNIIEPLCLMPNEKRTSVERLGFGTINKIFLFYDRPFWSENVKLINIIWVPEDDSFRLDKLMHRNCTRKIWHEDICKFEVVNSVPNALSGWISGSTEFERLDDKTIAHECTKILRRFLGNENIPEPRSIVRTKWNLNRYSRGTYAYLPIGSNPDDFNVLAKPIPSEQNPIVLFGGEATHSDYFSTVHGAYFTGIRESERILKAQQLNQLD